MAFRTAHLLLRRCWRWQEIAEGTIIPRNKPQGKFEDDSQKKRFPILDAQHISKNFAEASILDKLFGDAESVQAVQDVSLHVQSSMTLGIVGESGSGKTTLARAIVGLITADTGEIQLMEKPLSLKLQERSKEELAKLRMVFQNPNDALNPYRTVGQAMAHTYQVLRNNKASREETMNIP